MNFAKINFNSRIIGFGLMASIILMAISLSLTNFLTIYPELAIGVTYDLTLSLPLLYLFLIRKTKIPKATAIPVFVFGVLTASLILPAENRFHLDLIKVWLLPLVEVIALTFVGFTAYKTYKTYKSESGKSADVLEIIRETCRKIVFSPKIAEIAAFELAVFYYAALSWKAPVRENTFTYHKKSGIAALVSVVIFIVAVETLAVHILATRWNEILAWILTAASFYFILQIFAHLKAVFQRPIEVCEDKMFLRYGLFGDAAIDLENIESIEKTSAPFEKEKGVKKLALLGDLEQHNLKIKLKNEAVFKGFYGIKSKADTIFLFIDEADKFKDLIKKK